MSIIVFLPAGGGSKSIPEKNIKSFWKNLLFFGIYKNYRIQM